MKKQKGITLIALIITIIVMLILVAVTLTIALGDNGILKKARQSADDQQVEQDREKLLDWTMGTVDDKTLEIDKEELANIAKNNEWTVNGEIYISQYNNMFIVYSDGTIEKIDEISTITFPITVQVGKNAYATWTNDPGGGKITITGTGATYNFDQNSDSDTDSTANSIIDLFIDKIAETEEIADNGTREYNIIKSLVWLKVHATGSRVNIKTAIANMDAETLQNSGLTEDDVPIISDLAKGISEVEYLIYDEGITKIGKNNMDCTTIMKTLQLPSTLEEVATDAICESTFDNPIVVPSSVKKIGKRGLGQGDRKNTLYMKAELEDAETGTIQFTDGETLDNFKATYNITWGWNK